MFISVQKGFFLPVPCSHARSASSPGLGASPVCLIMIPVYLCTSLPNSFLLPGPFLSCSLFSSLPSFAQPPCGKDCVFHSGDRTASQSSLSPAGESARRAGAVAGTGPWEGVCSSFVSRFNTPPKNLVSPLSLAQHPACLSFVLFKGHPACTTQWQRGSCPSLHHEVASWGWGLSPLSGCVLHQERGRGPAPSHGCEAGARQWQGIRFFFVPRNEYPFTNPQF